MKKHRLLYSLALFACLAVFALPVLNNLLVVPALTGFLKSVGERKLVKLASRMTDLLDYDARLTSATRLPQDFLKEIEDDREMLDLTKVKIFTPEGLTIYATDRAEIGKMTEKEFFPEVIAGRRTRILVKTSDDKSPGKEVMLVETYVPIVKPAGVIGAFEIYYDMTEVRDDLARVITGLHRIITVVSLMLLGAVLVSAWLARRSELARDRAEEQKDVLIGELSRALEEIKTLRGILPLCSKCKKIRTDSGYWEQVDVYMHQYLSVDISHGICPDCAKELYPELYRRIEQRKKAAKGEDSA